MTIIALDTNQVTAFISTLDTVRGISPGHFGNVLADQIAAVSPWLEEARRAGDIVVFAGHHNWNQLNAASQERIGVMMLRRRQPAGLHFSAHAPRVLGVASHPDAQHARTQREFAVGLADLVPPRDASRWTSRRTA